MNVLMIGKHDSQCTENSVKEYEKRIKHYISFRLDIIPASKEQHILQYKEKEGIRILSKLNKSDFLILLDERGEEYTSVQMAGYIQKLQNQNKANVFFVIGGAHGFSEEVCQRADARISLSKLTFPHQLARIVFMEQLYRVFTILKGEKYHH
ncbi:Ribosomal RNA large subunit methyltransferase H [Flavobacteriales bacterium]|nr:Ribosomal RNA large subunit methyltransferase H [Flavobacteriales bacterium]WKZ75976.1 MAG: 23S rRNA (pseudouridine(1915)-N(3))-methyltransferase RlmH [Vicingaceae bacterium]GIK70416.1 MAG: ribosomal RNA large subunit methyltransferase H [Bacteroidota bacterium]CAG0981454.1 Ribosomal RNA large subunit methyltransferase H [Flavobacteriales bacterium]